MGLQAAGHSIARRSRQAATPALEEFGERPCSLAGLLRPALYVRRVYRSGFIAARRSETKIGPKPGVRHPSQKGPVWEQVCFSQERGRKRPVADWRGAFGNSGSCQPTVRTPPATPEVARRRLRTGSLRAAASLRKPARKLRGAWAAARTQLRRGAWSPRSSAAMPPRSRDAARSLLSSAS